MLISIMTRLRCGWKCEVSLQILLSPTVKEFLKIGQQNSKLWTNIEWHVIIDHVYQRLCCHLRSAVRHLHCTMCAVCSQSPDRTHATALYLLDSEHQCFSRMTDVRFCSQRRSAIRELPSRVPTFGFCRSAFFAVRRDATQDKRGRLPWCDVCHVRVLCRSE